MTNITINSLPTANTIDGSQDVLPIYTASALATQGISRNTLLGLTSAPLGLTDSQAPTNKTLGNTNTVTLKDTLFTLQDDGDVSKQLRFQLSGITTATTRTLTIPNISDTLVTLTASQTLTNKTLTSPTINAPTITNATISADTLSGFSSGTTGTVYGMSVAAGVLASAALLNTVNAAALQSGSVTYPKLGTDSSYAWVTWTPTWTNLTTGNGTTTAFYIQMGKTIYFRLKFVFGSTSSIGSDPSFTPPVAFNTAYSRVGSPFGGAEYFDTSGSTYFPGPCGVSVSNSNLNIEPYVINAASTYGAISGYTTTVPVAFGTGDEIHCNGFYQTT